MLKLLRIALAVATLLLVYLAWRFVVPEVVGLLYYIFIALIPFILAGIITIFIEPLVNLLHNKTKLSRSAAVGLSLLTVIGGLGTIITLIILRLVAELIDLSVSLPLYARPIEDKINGLIEQGRLFYFKLPQGVAKGLQESLNLDTISGRLSDMAGTLANSLLRIAGAVPGTIMVILVTLIATYFISRDRRIIGRLWVKVIPAPWGERSLEVGREVAGAFLSYVRAQFILISITIIQSIIGLQIIGAGYALTMGLVIGFFDMIPVLGPGTVIIPWAIWSFASGSGIFGMKLLVLYLLIMVVRQVLEAKVVAANLGLHPLAVLVAIYVGLKTLGVTGLVMGPILLIAAQAGIKAFQAHRIR